MSGDESGVGNGGPSGPPSGSGATYYLRFTKTNADNNSLYLQENFGADYDDLYMGAWWYFETGFRFRESVKFMDFRCSSNTNGHLAVSGFTHQGYYCNDTDYSAGDYINHAPAWGAGVQEGDHQFATCFRYDSANGTHVGTVEGNFNYYDVSATFDSNMDTDEVVVGRSGYNPANVNRVEISGGKWIAVIWHAKIHTTNGEYDMWIKDGEAALKKVMQWNRDTAWSSDNSTPHDFYTYNDSYPTTEINHVHFNSYWNNGTGYPTTQYMWLANPCVATTYAEVVSYLGLDEGSPLRTLFRP